MADTATAPIPTTPQPPAPEHTPNWLRYVAMLTGVLAGLGGFLSVKSANLSNDAIYHNSRAVLHQAQASDAWSEYQADSVKARVVETQLMAGVSEAPAKAALEAVGKDLRDRQPGLKQKAQDLEQQRDAELSVSGRRLGEKNNLDYAGVFVQLGIALASVAALTRRKAAFVAGLIAAAVGAGITAYVLAGHYLVKG